MLEQDIQIAEARAAGASLQEIASQNGFHESTACRKLQKPDIKKHIEAIQAKIADECYNQAAENISLAIKQYKPQAALKTEERDPQLREHGFKSSLRILESIGILPSHAPSIMIQQIYNTNNIINNDISKLLDNLYDKQQVLDVPVSAISYGDQSGGDSQEIVKEIA
jgi:predicted transcriptional regulator